MRILTIGSAIIDEIITLPRLPQPGEDITARETWSELGGCAANVAVCTARLGLETAIVCRLGDDQRGKLILNQLKEQGVDTTNIIIDPQYPSGYCLTLVEDSAQRSFITFNGANLKFTLADFPQERYDIIYLSGYELVEEDAAKSIVRYLTSQGNTQIVFDPGPALTQIPTPTFTHIASISAIITLNEDEARAYCKSTDPMVQAELLYSLGPKTAVIKLGKAGCCYKTIDSKGFVPGYPVTAVDTSGAGDAFAGACIYGLANNTPLPKALKFANAVGAMVVAGKGPQGPIPKLQDVIAFMKNKQE